MGNTGVSNFYKSITTSLKLRHLCVVVISIIGVYAFLESRSEWSAMHRWNRAVGDMSLLMVALAMAVGPLSRLSARCRGLVLWRRELGIYGVILAIVHTVIILDGWIEWDLIRLFGYELHPTLAKYVMVQHGFALANSIGILALLYGLVLALTSNDLSQKKLGAPVWKFLQQGSYVYWMLIVVHTGYFLYLHFQDFHRRTPDPNWLQQPFAWLVCFVVLLQLSASIKTWRLSRKTVQA
ncbi:MAG: sulfoxide reductase heme-binding subunit YedZ [Gammaproteobacteria bacterium]